MAVDVAAAGHEVCADDGPQLDPDEADAAHVQVRTLNQAL